MGNFERGIMQETLNRFKTIPKKHQRKWLKDNGRKKVFALLDDMGTGKTWIVINDIADLWSSGDCYSVLVLAPNGVHSNWTRLELPEHMPDWCRYKSVTWYANPNWTEKRELEKMYEGEEGQLIIFAMNHEAIQTKRGFEAAKKFCETARKLMIVVDEADAFKNPTAKRTEKLMRLKPFSDIRRIMTGTLINNAPYDAFIPFSFLDEEILGTTSYYAMKAEYCELLRPGHPLLENIKKSRNLRRTPQIVARDAQNNPKYRNMDKLARLIAPYSSRNMKSECLDLPDKIYKTLIFRLTPQQIEVYKKAEDECRLVFENVETPFERLAAMTKLAQITSGYYLHPLAEEPVRIEGGNPKLDLIEERVLKIIEEGEKIIIWARYRVEIADIVAMLKKNGIKTVEYHGGIKKHERVETLDSFENGDAQVFVGNPQAGGIGLNLVAASYVLYFSNDYSWRKRSQSEDRAHRIGQTKNVIYLNFAAKGTVDEKAIGVLANKQGISAIIDLGIKMFGG